MAEDKWLRSDELAKIARDRLKTSTGRAEKIVRKALASGQVREHPRFAADDGWPYRNLMQGGVVPLAVRYPGYYSEADFISWLDLEFDKGKASKSKARPRRYRNASDAALVKEGRKMVAGGMTKMAAARVVAKKATGGSLEQRIERFRKLL
jgi:hypothetical protein